MSDPRSPESDSEHVPTACADLDRTPIADTLARASVTTNIMPRPGPDPPAGTVTEARAARPAAGAAATARARAPVGAPEALRLRGFTTARPAKVPGSLSRIPGRAGTTGVLPAELRGSEPCCSLFLFLFLSRSLSLYLSLSLSPLPTPSLSLCARGQGHSCQNPWSPLQLRHSRHVMNLAGGGPGSGAPRFTFGAAGSKPFPNPSRTERVMRSGLG